MAPHLATSAGLAGDHLLPLLSGCLSGPEKEPISLAHDVDHRTSANEVHKELVDVSPWAQSYGAA